ncbi:hypothetical protein [Yersinia bercovieri]|uniref:Uncharacterized protein n=1 Tax=Yersinia bercovieri ATCC 43970 TaxID=349968 RepID=A0ABM9XWW8_YERBE|nr:hypothetical protein [Yersinia bercovieri]EEQ05855.1 hypothetical protein yberc0001_28480 [Yersinia bercovieri ATCC 43970]QKJ05496.1 hypothetical protein HRK25_00265 [Yersinia bercovieri ATCC 43970]
MKAGEFNRRYPVGKVFIYQPCKFLRGGKSVKTVGPAHDFDSATVVEINKEPYFDNTESLTPAG